MALITDERLNPVAGPIDLITGNVFTDTRPTTVLLAVLNAETVMELNGQTSVLIDARSAAFSGTLVVQGTVDGTNWLDIPVTNMATQAALVNIVLTGANGLTFTAHVGGFQAIRVRVTAYTSGNIAIGMRATVAAIRPSLERPYPTTLWVTATGAAAAGATATLPAGAAGLFHYITHIDITRNATAAVVGTATLIHTSTNLVGSPAWSVGNAIAAGGTEKDVWIDFAQPLKSSVAATNTTIVAAAGGAAVLNRINVGYFLGA